MGSNSGNETHHTSGVAIVRAQRKVAFLKLVALEQRSIGDNVLKQIEVTALKTVAM